MSAERPGITRCAKPPVVSGYVTPGYHRAPELDAGAFDQDGYFLTGDIGSIEADATGKIHKPTLCHELAANIAI